MSKYLAEKIKIKEILVDLAASDKLPMDMNSLSSSIFYPALKNEKNKKEIAKRVRDIIIQQAVNDDLPMDMNEFDTSLLDPAFIYAMGGLTPEKARIILDEGMVHGHPITDQQRKFFGAIASGYPLRKKHEKGGEVQEDEYDPENDLFDKYDTLPKKVQRILDKYSGKEPTYKTNDKMLKELEPLGYTFDYYVDASPYNLRKIKKEGLTGEDNKKEHGGTISLNKKGDQPVKELLEWLNKKVSLKDFVI